MEDKPIAAALSCTVESVRKARLRLAQGTLYTPRDRSKLPWEKADWTRENEEIARLVGCSVSYVAVQRRRRAPAGLGPRRVGRPRKPAGTLLAIVERLIAAAKTSGPPCVPLNAENLFVAASPPKARPLLNRRMIQNCLPSVRESLRERGYELRHLQREDFEVVVGQLAAA